MFSLPLAVSATAVLLTFCAAAYQDKKSRTVYRATWYPAAAVCLVCGIFFWPEILRTEQGLLILLFAIFFSLLFAAFAYFGLFGKADAKALILLSLAVPVTPFADWIFPSLAVSSLLNAGLLSLLIPVVCLAANLLQKNRAPFWLMCSGMPVSGNSVKNRFGFLAETVCEEEGKITKEFVRMRDALFSLKRPPEYHTRNLREHPELYAETLVRLEKCETVWVTVGIPLLVPLTAGLVPALFGISAADIFLSLLF